MTKPPGLLQEASIELGERVSAPCKMILTQLYSTNARQVVSLSP